MIIIDDAKISSSECNTSMMIEVNLHRHHHHQATNMGLTVGIHPVKATLTIPAGAS